MSEISGPLAVEEAQYLIEAKIATIFSFAAATNNPVEKNQEDSENLR